MTDHDPRDPIEQSGDLARIKRAYQIACMNLAELGEQRSKLANALDGALMLIDRLLAEMREQGVTPSPQIIAFKAGFDQGMRKLLGQRDKDEP
jgi:hypothetical protein